MPLVSVIMPSYNHEKFISIAIGSVLNQTFTDFELIIIDDASKDRSKEIIKVYQERENRIHAIFHDENKGIAKTMNEGIEEAGGKFIASIASDDVWVKDKLKKQLKTLEKNEDLVVWSEGLIIDAQGNHIGELFTQKHGASEKKKSGHIFEELLKGNFIFGSSRILKRENIGDIRYNERLRYLNDYQFAVDLARKYEYYFIPEPLAMYRLHGRNVILSDIMGWRKDWIIVREHFLQKYGNEISNKLRSELLLSIAKGYLNIGEKAKARQYVYHAIRLNPFCRANLCCLVISLTNDHGAIRTFLRWNYQKYKDVKDIGRKMRARIR